MIFIDDTNSHGTECTEKKKLGEVLVSFLRFKILPDDNYKK